MMITTPYMVFKFRYASDPNLVKVDKNGFLFYDTMARQLFELPPITSSREKRDRAIYPIRSLSDATLIAENINFKDFADYSHNSTVLALLQGRHPGPVRRIGDGFLLRVVCENRQIISHRPKWELQPSGYWDSPYGRWLWPVHRMGRYRRTRIRCSCSFYKNTPLGFLVEPESCFLVPDRTKKQTYDFRSVCVATCNGTPIGYAVEETRLETNGRSKHGKLTRWAWMSHGGNNTKMMGPYSVEMKAEKPSTCIIEGEKQGSLEQLYYTLSDIIQSHNP